MQVLQKIGIYVYEHTPAGHERFGGRVMHSLWSRRSPGRQDRFALAIGGQALWQPCTRLAHQAHHGNAEAGQVRGGPPRHMGAPLAAQAARECPAPPLSPGRLAPEALKRPLCCVLLREVAHEKLSYFTHCLPRPSELGGCSAFPEANRERSGKLGTEQPGHEVRPRFPF